MNFDVRDYDRWIYRLANDMLWANSSARNFLTVDDLAQEGRVAMWAASQKFDPSRGNLPAHVTNAARKRMIDVISGRKPSFGTEGNRGRVKVPETSLTPWPEPDDPAEPIAPSGPPEGRPDVLAAIQALPAASREYVERVFWGGERLRRDRAAWKIAEEMLSQSLKFI